MNDLESNSSIRKGLLPSKPPLEEQTSTCSAWKLLLCASLICFWAVHALAPTLVVELSSASDLARGVGDSNHNAAVNWHIKPIKPRHSGKVVFLTEHTDDGVVYKRIFTAPCGDGMLVFNVGPAAEYQPFAYEIYDDAYAYSNNQGLCVFYPSYQGVQTSDSIMWNASDPTEMQVSLGDLPTKISTRVVKKSGTKDEQTRGGDFLIMRSGNFYTPAYYKHLKDAINNWPADASVEANMEELIAALE